MDYADDCINDYQEKQSRLDAIADEEDRRIEDILDDGDLVGELITDNQLGQVAGVLIKDYLNNRDHKSSLKQFAEAVLNAARIEANKHEFS